MTKRNEVLGLFASENDIDFEGEFVDEESYDNADKVENLDLLEQAIREDYRLGMERIKKRMDACRDQKEANL
jgi:hypothetical protein